MKYETAFNFTHAAAFSSKMLFIELKIHIFVDASIVLIENEFPRTRSERRRRRWSHAEHTSRQAVYLSLQNVCKLNKLEDPFSIFLRNTTRSQIFLLFFLQLQFFFVKTIFFFSFSCIMFLFFFLSILRRRVSTTLWKGCVWYHANVSYGVNGCIVRSM